MQCVAQLHRVAVPSRMIRVCTATLQPVSVGVGAGATPTTQSEQPLHRAVHASAAGQCTVSARKRVGRAAVPSSASALGARRWISNSALLRSGDWHQKYRYADGQLPKGWVYAHQREANPDPDERAIIVGRKKKKVALWVGFNGQGYAGSQKQSHLNNIEKTIEGVLEESLYQAGQMHAGNRGNLKRVQWGRSSRTDRGVSSLALIISLKMLCPPGSFGEDPEEEGPDAPEVQGAYAKCTSATLRDELNAALPPDIRVFQVSRVTKSFRARYACSARSYEYLLPTSALGIPTGSAEEDAARISKFRAALNLYEGWHPFHNFTHRKQYAPKAYADKGKKKKKKSEDDDEDMEMEGEVEDSVDDAQLLEKEFLGKSEMRTNEDGSTTHYYAYWLDEIRDSDRIGQAHWRKIVYCSCGDVETATLEDGPVDYLTVRLQGNGFMIHQIRYMIGAAVCHAQGVIPFRFLRSALSVPSRVRLPRAPPHGLVLVHADFFPPRPIAGKPEDELDTEPALELQPEGKELKDAFQKSELLPALHPFLRHSDWAPWTRAVAMFNPSEEQVEMIVGKSDLWEAENIKKSIAREEERAAYEERKAEREKSGTTKEKSTQRFMDADTRKPDAPYETPVLFKF